MKQRPTRLFCYRLAARLGVPNVRKMMSQLSSLDVAEWSAYFRIVREEEEEEAMAQRAAANLGRH